jgi:hypothetical protein
MKDNNIRKLFVNFITELLYNKYFQNIEIYPIDKIKTLDFVIDDDDLDINYYPSNLSSLRNDIDKLIYDFNKQLSNHYKFLNKIKIKLNKFV